MRRHPYATVSSLLRLSLRLLRLLLLLRGSRLSSSVWIPFGAAAVAKKREKALSRFSLSVSLHMVLIMKPLLR